MTLEVTTFTAPAYWASYFVNGDASGLDDDEVAAADHWLDIKCQPEGWYIVDVARDENGEGQEPRFTWSYDQYSHTATRGGDVLDYVAHRQA